VGALSSIQIPTSKINDLGLFGDLPGRRM